MGVLLPIEGAIALITVTGILYYPQDMERKTFDYAMIDVDAIECISSNDYGDYNDFVYEEEISQNVTTLNVTHLDEVVILRALQVIEFEKPLSYMNLTDEQYKKLTTEGFIPVGEVEITIPEAIANVKDKETNKTGSVEVPSVVLITKEEERCLIIVRDQETKTGESE